MNWTPPPDGSIKINVDASKRYNTGATTIGFVRKDMRDDIVIA